MSFFLYLHYQIWSSQLFMCFFFLQMLVCLFLSSKGFICLISYVLIKMRVALYGCHQLHIYHYINFSKCLPIRPTVIFVAFFGEKFNIFILHEQLLFVNSVGSGCILIIYCLSGGILSWVCTYTAIHSEMGGLGTRTDSFPPCLNRDFGF